MATSVYFSESYQEARTRFLNAAHKCKAEVGFRPYGQKDSHTGELFVDIARIGDPRGKRVLVIISGTHGVEGFCGSACQTAWLSEQACDRPSGVTVYLIHALNPYGFAWHRRVNEDNIDLNRNFLNFDSDLLPDNPEYRELEPLLNPRSLVGGTLGKLDPALEGWFAPDKVKAFKAATAKGQYEFPKGNIFGGRAATWSNRLLRDFIRSLPSPLEAGIVLDIHTGLGEAGELEMFTEERLDKFSRIKDWFKSRKVTTLGDHQSLGYVITGSLYRAFTEPNTAGPWYCVAMEFGTQPLMQVLLALQADNWLHCFASGQHALSTRVQSLMSDAFLVPSKCQNRVISTTLEVVSCATAALEAFGDKWG
jgi:predicted deacylase